MFLLDLLVSETRNINLQFHTGKLFSHLRIKFVALESFFQDRRSFGFFFDGNAPFDVGTDGLIDDIISPYFDLGWRSKVSIGDALYLSMLQVPTEGLVVEGLLEIHQVVCVEAILFRQDGIAYH